MDSGLLPGLLHRCACRRLQVAARASAAAAGAFIVTGQQHTPQLCIQPAAAASAPNRPAPGSSGSSFKGSNLTVKPFKVVQQCCHVRQCSGVIAGSSAGSACCRRDWPQPLAAGSCCRCPRLHPRSHPAAAAAAGAALVRPCCWLLLLLWISCSFHQQPVRLFRRSIRPKVPRAAATVDAPKQHVQFVSVLLLWLLLLHVRLLPPADAPGRCRLCVPCCPPCCSLMLRHAQLDHLLQQRVICILKAQVKDVAVGIAC